MVKKNILISIPTGFSFRNFILTDFPVLCGQFFNPVFLINHNLLSKSNVILLKKYRINYIPFSYNKSFLVRILTKLRCTLVDFKLSSDSRNLNKGYLFSIISQIVNSHNILNKLICWIEVLTYYNEKFVTKECSEKLSSLSYQFIFFTYAHQNIEAQLLSWGKFNSAKLINIVSSWDVIRTKATYVTFFDYAIVWNEINKFEYRSFFCNQLHSNTEIMVCENLYQSKLIQIRNELFSNKPKPSSKVLLYAAVPDIYFPQQKDFLNELVLLLSKLNYDELIIRKHPQSDNLTIQNVNFSSSLTVTIAGDDKDSRVPDSLNINQMAFENIVKQINSSTKVISPASTFLLDSLTLGSEIGVLLPTPEKLHSFGSPNWYSSFHIERLCTENKVFTIFDESDLISFLDKDNLLSSKSTFSETYCLPTDSLNPKWKNFLQHLQSK